MTDERAAQAIRALVRHRREPGARR
jgi:hypothetical protein